MLLFSNLAYEVTATVIAFMCAVINQPAPAVINQLHMGLQKHRVPRTMCAVINQPAVINQLHVGLQKHRYPIRSAQYVQ